MIGQKHVKKKHSAPKKILKPERNENELPEELVCNYDDRIRYKDELKLVCESEMLLDIFGFEDETKFSAS